MSIFSEIFACVSHITELSHDLIFSGCHLDSTSLGSKGKPTQIKIAVVVHEILVFHLNLVFRAREYVGVLWWSLRVKIIITFKYYLLLYCLSNNFMNKVKSYTLILINFLADFRIFKAWIWPNFPNAHFIRLTVAVLAEIQRSMSLCVMGMQMHLKLSPCQEVTQSTLFN